MIFTDTLSQHAKVLDQVLDRLVGARLTAKPSRCFIGYRQLECLDHTIGHGKLSPECLGIVWALQKLRGTLVGEGSGDRIRSTAGPGQSPGKCFDL